MADFEYSDPSEEEISTGDEIDSEDEEEDIGYSRLPLGEHLFEFVCVCSCVFWYACPLSSLILDIELRLSSSKISALFSASKRSRDEPRYRTQVC